MKWVHLTTAPNQIIAEMWKGLLDNNSIPAILRPEDTSSFLGVSSRPCDLMVDEALVEEARSILSRDGASVQESEDSDAEL